MKIALSQLNVTPGALLTNQAKITDYMHKAAGEGADGGAVARVHRLACFSQPEAKNVKCTH